MASSVQVVCVGHELIEGGAFNSYPVLVDNNSPFQAPEAVHPPDYHSYRFKMVDRPVFPHITVSFLEEQGFRVGENYVLTLRRVVKKAKPASEPATP